MTDNVDGKLKIVKGIVFFMTFLLIVGIVMIIYAVTHGKKDKDMTEQGATGPNFEPITIRSDKKTVIKEMIECGGMLCVAVSSKDMENILIVNPKTGKIQGNVNLVVDKDSK